MKIAFLAPAGAMHRHNGNFGKISSLRSPNSHHFGRFNSPQFTKNAMRDNADLPAPHTDDCCKEDFA